MLLDKLQELEPRHTQAVHAGNELFEEFSGFCGKLFRPLLDRFAQRRGHFRGSALLLERPAMLLELRADFGKVKILFAREQRAGKRIAGIERMTGDLAERGEIRRGLKIELGGREFLNRRRSIFTNCAPRIEYVFDSHHTHIVAKARYHAAGIRIPIAGGAARGIIKMMHPGRRSTLAALLGIASSAVAQRGGADPGRPLDPQEDVKLPNGKSQREEILKAERDKNIKDAAELVDLTQQLQQDIEKNDVFVFSLAELKKMDDIEKLVKKIRGRVRHF
jgi:hypothetical protein